MCIVEGRIFFSTFPLPSSPFVPSLPIHISSLFHISAHSCSLLLALSSIFSAFSPHVLHSPLSPFLISFVFLSLSFSQLSPFSVTLFSSSAQCVQTGVRYTASSDLFCLGKLVWLTACCSLSASSVHSAHNTGAGCSL